MSDIRTPQNPGISGLDELTSTEEALLQELVAIAKTKGNIFAANGTSWVALEIGSSGRVLTAAPDADSGLRYTVVGTVPLFADDETPSGTINSSNKTFTLANTPSPAASLHLMVEGGELIFGGTEPNGYSLSGDTITMVTAPITGTTLRANYRH